MDAQNQNGTLTLPSPRTEDGGSGAATTIIAWGHPRTATSVLSDGHVFGRETQCTTVLTSAEVSRRHAIVQQEGIVPVLRDLDSRNGVFVNGQRIREQPLGPLDVVRMGDWVGVVVQSNHRKPRAYELLELGPGWYASERMACALEPVRNCAVSALSLVIQGESGAGKEGVARAVHRWSGRTGKFVPLDCGTLPEQLAEAHLFGHRQGAFTGADQASLGYFRSADRGTLFLDEVLNLTPAVQAKLLRALEQGEVVPVGETRAVPVDVRVICAAQRPLADAVEQKVFREDLWSRLDGLTFALPPLREHKEDVLPLFRRLLAAEDGEPPCDARFAEAMLLYHWPKNVRELVQLARRLKAQLVPRPYTRAALPVEMRTVRADLAASAPGSEPAPRQSPASRLPVDDPAAFEALQESLRKNQGNMTRATQELGISRNRGNRIRSAHPEFDLDTLRKQGAD